MSAYTPKKILLVEDEAIIALSEKKALEKFGFEVQLALSGLKAIEAMRASPDIDLVLMDINLGAGIDGTETATSILEAYDIPLVFLTSHTEKAVVEKTEGITSYGYIIKNSGDLVLLASINMAFKLFESKRSEKEKSEALLISEKKYRKLIENSHDIIFTLNSDGTFSYVSPAWTHLLGHPVAEVIGSSFRAFMHPDDAFKCGGLFEPFAQAEASGAGFEYRMRHVDGTWRWHISRCQPILDESGTVTGFEGIATDITERKSEEDALFENQSNLRTVLDGVDGSICFLDRTGTILEANRNFVIRLGKTMDECLGKNVFDLLPPDLARTRSQFVAQVFKTGDPVTFEDQRQDRWIRQTLTPVKDSSGKVIRVVVYATDVTEQKKIMEDLRVSAALYGTLFQVLPMGITVTDETGKIVDSNSVALKLLGVSRKEHTKRTIDGQEWRIVRKDGSTMPACEFASTKALKEKRLVENVEMGIVKEPDAITWINVSACPIPIEDYGVVVSYNDISERIQAEQMLASLLKEKDLTLKETHHRIKNNMGTIASLLSLQSNGQKDENVSNILNDAASRVRSMMVLYEKLYDSENFCSLSMKTFLPPLVESIMGLFSNIHAVRTEVTVDDFMLGSKILSSLGIIINELITNSMKYAFGDIDDGMIRISATRTGSNVVLVYEDNGPGLPASVELENSGGFGMQLLKMLVQQIAGSMRLEKADGARFVIEFNA